jgi:hypothetical protein
MALPETRSDAISIIRHTRSRAGPTGHEALYQEPRPVVIGLGKAPGSPYRDTINQER